MSKSTETVREYAQENEEDLREILRHSDDPYLRACAGAILSRGLSDPEIDRVIADLERGREALS